MNQDALTADPASSRRDHTPEFLLGEWAASTAPVYCRNLGGAILAANTAFSRKVGHAIPEIAGRDASTFINPEDLVAFETANAELGRPPHQAAPMHRWLTPQGWRWIGSV